MPLISPTGASGDRVRCHTGLSYDHTRRWRSVWAALLAMTAMVAYGCFGPGEPVGPGAAAAEEATKGVLPELHLPWPAEGQASVLVDGLGSLGGLGRQEPVPIASLAKVMTAYVLLKGHPLARDEPGRAIEVDKTAAYESVSGTETTAPVRAGQRLSQRKLLELMLLPSANNIARFLARWDSGSQEAFVQKMNRAATGLGMKNTIYTGASGIETTTESTADDQLKLAQEAMKDRTFRSIVAQRSTTVPGSPDPIRNTNELLGSDGVIGLKTGTTTPAGGNLLWATKVRAGGKERLVLGAVLHQRADTSPMEASEAAQDASRSLIRAVRQGLPAALTEGESRT
jgi:D-alanyl-D-alanine carboxypeptidase (penicillin-binding protein 5/6)